MPNKIPKDTQIHTLSLKSGTGFEPPEVGEFKLDTGFEPSEVDNPLGGLVGKTPGWSLGTKLGPMLGRKLGSSLGTKLGLLLGKMLGPSLGSKLGSLLGSKLGPSLGSKLGSLLGNKLGLLLGIVVVKPGLGDILGMDDEDGDDVSTPEGDGLGM